MSDFIQKIKYFFNIKELSEVFSEIMSGISDFFSYIYFNIPRVFAIYFLIIGIFVFFANRIFKNFVSSRSLCLHEIDKILYKISLVIQKERDNIHNFPETIKLLFTNQKKILTDEDSNFISNFDDLLVDVRYIEKLLQINIVKQEEINKIETIIDIVKKNRMLYLGLMSIVGIITIGIGSFFKKDTKI